MGDIDTTKVRRCSPLLEPPAPGIVVELCDEIDTIRARVAELEASVAVEAANGKHWAAAYSKWVQTDEAAKKLIEQEERIAGLESALAKSASRESALVEKLTDAYEEGWHACACWAGRDDLHCDTSSEAYTDERNERLAKIKEAS